MLSFRLFKLLYQYTDKRWKESQKMLDEKYSQAFWTFEPEEENSFLSVSVEVFVQLQNLNT